jgi:hypothetical protein
VGSSAHHAHVYGAHKTKSETKDKWDIFEVIAEVPAQGQSAEAIAIPRAESLCKMEPAD